MNQCSIEIVIRSTIERTLVRYICCDWWLSSLLIRAARYYWTERSLLIKLNGTMRGVNFCVQVTVCKSNEFAHRSSLSKLMRHEVCHAFYPLSNNTKVSIKCRIIESQDEKCTRETKRKGYSIHNVQWQLANTIRVCNISIANLALCRFHLQAFIKCTVRFLCLS